MIRYFLTNMVIIRVDEHFSYKGTCLHARGDVNIMLKMTWNKDDSQCIIEINDEDIDSSFLQTIITECDLQEVSMEFFNQFCNEACL